MTQLPSLERWALLPFLGFSYPNLLACFSEPVTVRNLYICFSQVFDLSLVSFLFYFIFLYPVQRVTTSEIGHRLNKEKGTG